MDSHTRRWVDELNRSGLAYVTPATLDGRWMVRISIGALPTEQQHVAALWTQIQDAATRSLSQP
jgi:aromatic-L-amino-acid decarboxylase